MLDLRHLLASVEYRRGPISVGFLALLEELLRVVHESEAGERFAISRRASKA